MYQRSYYPSDEAVITPPNEYDGNLNFEKERVVEESTECSVGCAEKGKKNGFFQFFNSDIMNIFHSPEFGLEEILLIGAALFLLISKSGDFECIFILLSLLFVR